MGRGVKEGGKGKEAAREAEQLSSRTTVGDYVQGVMEGKSLKSGSGKSSEGETCWGGERGEGKKDHWKGTSINAAQARVFPKRG